MPQFGNSCYTDWIIPILELDYPHEDVQLKEAVRRFLEDDLNHECLFIMRDLLNGDIRHDVEYTSNGCSTLFGRIETHVTTHDSFFDESSFILTSELLWISQVFLIAKFPV